MTIRVRTYRSVSTSMAMLGAYSEMTHATVARVMELRVGIEEHVDALDRWKERA